MEDEAIELEAISIAQVVNRYRGKVIIQVKHLARRGSLHPKQVVVPGIYVDASYWRKIMSRNIAKPLLPSLIPSIAEI